MTSISSKLSKIINPAFFFDRLISLKGFLQIGEMYKVDQKEITTDLELVETNIKFDDETIKVVLKRDASERKKKLRLLKDDYKTALASQAFSETLISSMNAPFYCRDEKGEIIVVNKSFENLFDLNSSEIVGKRDNDVFPERIQPILQNLWNSCLAGKKKCSFEIRLKIKEKHFDYLLDASPFYEEGKLSGVVSVFHDITERKKTEDELRELASKDDLTKVYNRRFFTELADASLNAFKRDLNNPDNRDNPQKPFGLCFMMLDIDHFKNINDTYGHPGGDQVLIKLSSELKKTLSRFSSV